MNVNTTGLLDTRLELLKLDLSLILLNNNVNEVIKWSFCRETLDYNLRYHKALLHIFPHLHRGRTDNKILHSSKRGTHAWGCGLHAMLYSSVQAGISPWVQCTNKPENNNNNSYDSLELHPVDKYVSGSLFITEFSLVLCPTHPGNASTAGERYECVTIFMY